MKLVLKIAGGIILAIIVLTVGCSALVSSSVNNTALSNQAGVIRVDAPFGKCWVGAIGDSSKDGCGSSSFDVSETIIVGNAQKMTPGDWKLELILEIDGKEIDRSSTTAEYGGATVSE